MELGGHGTDLRDLVSNEFYFDTRQALNVEEFLLDRTLFFGHGGLTFRLCSEGFEERFLLAVSRETDDENQEPHPRSPN